ncbi:MAG TPA: LamG domain-containing protein [Kofleriaceae bacterium]|nr:LamG domain-containing protein [Kofleriaceae bacterium]
MLERAYAHEHRQRLAVIGLIAATGSVLSCGSPDDIDDPAGEVRGAAEPARSCVASAPDERTAEHVAAACGARVEVESGRTEYSELYVEPSGHRTIATAVVPQRVRRHDGTWARIDTTLQQDGARIVPAATAANVQFSAGGAGPFVTLERDGHRFTLEWPTPLPRPTLSGNTATYAEVLPGVDLVVKATESGFSHLLVVKTARAAAHPAVRSARYRVGGDATLTTTADGGLVAQAEGVRVAWAEPPLMWDTGEDRAGAQAIRGAASPPGRISRVGSAITAGHLVLTPDAALLEDPGAAFPLVIDPTWNPAQNQWAYASADNQNGPTTDGTIAPGDPNPAAACLRVGNDPGSSHLIRSFMRFPINGLAGSQIVAANISGQVDHTWKCGANRPTFFYRTDAIAATPRQAWPGPALRVLLGNNNVHANEASCNEPNMRFEVSTTALRNDLQTFADARAASYYVAISAGENFGGNETDQERWMRYFLNDFRLNVTFNRKPNPPDNLTVDGKPCVSGTDRPFVKTTTPTLRAHVTDPDNDTLKPWFAWNKWNGSAWIGEPGNGPGSIVPSGGTALFNVVGNVDGGIYQWRMVTDDDPSHNPYLVSDTVGNCEWQVDITPPVAPAVTSDIYLEGPTACPGGACGAVGQTGRFTFSSSPDTKSFLWGLSDPPTNIATPSALGDSVSIDWTPAASGPYTLHVRAIDRAGNEANKIYQFVVAAESTAVARWLLNEPAGASQLVDDTGHGNAVAAAGGVLGATGRIVPGADGISRSAMQFDGTSAGVTTGPVLADTSRSFSLAAWVKLTDGSVTRYVISQSGGVPAFMLEYSRDAAVWKLTAPSADGTQYPGPGATSVPRLNTWTHLVGTYDSAAHEMRIYVNGTLESVATGITVRNATGTLQIGRSWAGSISEVQVWNRVISAAEVFELSDPILVGCVGEWHMDEVGPGPAFDASGLAHDLTFFNGALIPASGAGQSGTGLRLDGVDDYAAPDTQVLHTDQSFTVSLWARPSSSAAIQSLVSQQSTATSPGFSLGFSTDSGGQWKLTAYGSPTDTTGTTVAAAPAVNVTTSFHHLVGVFDAQKREIRLHVDGVLRATTAMSALWQPWDATGRLLIGRRHNGTAGIDFTRGDLDEVRVYQGAILDATRIP